jgi:hypothetical protein
MKRSPTKAVTIQTRAVCLGTYTRHWFKELKGRQGRRTAVCQRPGCGHRNARWAGGEEGKAEGGQAERLGQNL